MTAQPPSPRLAARHRHIARLRRRVAATAAAVFIALFGAIYIRVAGEDAAAAAKTAPATVQTDASPASGTSATTPDGSSSSSDTQLAPATTSQS